MITDNIRKILHEDYELVGSITMENVLREIIVLNLITGKCEHIDWANVNCAKYFKRDS